MDVGTCQHLSVTSTHGSRPTYHHGDLRNALVRAAARLAEQGGPDAVTIRAAAREVGVTPTATYRHFSGQQELLAAAKESAFDGMSAAMAGYLAKIPTEGDPVETAVRAFEATGRGYIRFAIEQPGLFRTAFCSPEIEGDELPEPADTAPYAMLTEALDRLVEVGHLDPALRPQAEASAWAAVHGLSLLIIDGPLKGLTTTERQVVVDRTLQMVSRGLAGGPSARL